MTAQANCLPIESVSWVSMWPRTWPGELLEMDSKRISSERISTSVCVPWSTNNELVDSSIINAPRKTAVTSLFTMGGFVAGGK